MSPDHNEMESGTNNRKIGDTHKYEKIKRHSPKQPTGKRKK